MAMHVNTVVASVVSSAGDDAGYYAPYETSDRHAPNERTRLITRQPQDSLQAHQGASNRRPSTASDTTITYASALSGSESESERASTRSSHTLVPAQLPIEEPSRWARCKRWLACVLCCHVPT